LILLQGGLRAYWQVAQVNALQQVERRERYRLLWGAIERLSHPEQVVLALHYYERWSLARMGRHWPRWWPKPAYLHGRALDSLRQQLKEAGVLAPD